MVGSRCQWWVHLMTLDSRCCSRYWLCPRFQTLLRLHLDALPPLMKVLHDCTTINNWGCLLVTTHPNSHPSLLVSMLVRKGFHCATSCGRDRVTVLQPFPSFTFPVYSQLPWHCLLVSSNLSFSSSLTGMHVSGNTSMLGSSIHELGSGRG